MFEDVPFKNLILNFYVVIDVVARRATQASRTSGFGTCRGGYATRKLRRGLCSFVANKFCGHSSCAQTAPCAAHHVAFRSIIFRRRWWRRSVLWSRYRRKCRATCKEKEQCFRTIWRNSPATKPNRESLRNYTHHLFPDSLAVWRRRDDVSLILLPFRQLDNQFRTFWRHVLRVRSGLVTEACYGGSLRRVGSEYDSTVFLWRPILWTGPEHNAATCYGKHARWHNYERQWSREHVWIFNGPCLIWTIHTDTNQGSRTLQQPTGTSEEETSIHK